MVKAVVGTLALVAAVGGLVWIGFAIRDTVARGTDPRRDSLVLQQRLGLAGLFTIPSTVFGLWVLEIELGRSWWMFVLLGIAAINSLIATIQLRRYKKSR